MAIPRTPGRPSRSGRPPAAADLKGVFLEASFPNAMADLAVVSKHLTPAMFAAEARKLARQVPFVAVHIKPRFYDQVVAELKRLGHSRLAGGQAGRDLRLLRGRALNRRPRVFPLSRPWRDRLHDRHPSAKTGNRSGWLVWSSCARASPFRGEAGRPREIASVRQAGETHSLYLRGTHCAACHDQEKYGKMLKKEIDGLICRMNEFPIYENQDKHTARLQSPDRLAAADDPAAGL